MQNIATTYTLSLDDVQYILDGLKNLRETARETDQQNIDDLIKRVRAGLSGVDNPPPFAGKTSTNTHTDKESAVAGSHAVIDRGDKSIRAHMSATWSDRYEAMVKAHAPGEKQLLLVANNGDGVFIAFKDHAKTAAEALNVPLQQSATWPGGKTLFPVVQITTAKVKALNEAGWHTRSYADDTKSFSKFLELLAEKEAAAPAPKPAPQTPAPKKKRAAKVKPLKNDEWEGELAAVQTYAAEIAARLEELVQRAPDEGRGAIATALRTDFLKSVTELAGKTELLTQDDEGEGLSALLATLAKHDSSGKSMAARNWMNRRIEEQPALKAAA